MRKSVAIVEADVIPLVSPLARLLSDPCGEAKPLLVVAGRFPVCEIGGVDDGDRETMAFECPDRKDSDS